MGRTTEGPLCAQSPGWALLRDPGLSCRTWHPNLKTVRFLPPLKHLSNSWLVTCWGTPINRVCFSGNKMNWSVKTCPTCSHLVNKAVLGWTGVNGKGRIPRRWQSLTTWGKPGCLLIKMEQKIFYLIVNLMIANEFDKSRDFATVISKN